MYSVSCIPSGPGTGWTHVRQESTNDPAIGPSECFERGQHCRQLLSCKNCGKQHRTGKSQFCTTGFPNRLSRMPLR
eukprot:6451146-Amphidinium_carterae.1